MTDAPWNSCVTAALSPKQFEEAVLAWLREWAKEEGLSAEISHQGSVQGAGGEYAIDVLLRATLLGGALLVILVECKHQRRPVERDELLILEGKLRDVGAHKGMLFATTGFQSGAIEYASARGIATITVSDGQSQYLTRSVGNVPAPPPWVQLPAVVGTRMSAGEDGIVRGRTLESGRLDALRGWFREPSHSG